MDRPPRRGGRGGGGGGGNWGFGGGEVSRKITIPVRSKGRVIGKGGSTVRDIERNANVRINLSRDETPDGEVEVTIIGSEECIEQAARTIEEVVQGGRRNDGDWGQEQFHTSKTFHSQSRENDWGTFQEPPPQPVQATPEWYGQDERTRMQMQHAARMADIGNIDFLSLNEECDKMQELYWAKFPPVIKEFYRELPEVRDMSDEEVAELRMSLNNISVERPLSKIGGARIPNPVRSFYEAFHNYPGILELIDLAGFTTPTPIQCQAWPVLLSGEDMIGIAQTGTGKTLAFLLPALIHIDSQITPRAERGGPSALVLAPTRELALQIEAEVQKYNYKGITSLCVYGGSDRRKQRENLKGVEIIIATPGRLDDFVQSGDINPETFTYVVLDEADRMLDMGFEPQIRKTLYKIRPNRHTVMTSATWPPGVRRLAQSYTKDPVTVYVGSLDLTAAHSVTQTILMVDDDEQAKFQTFLDFIRQIRPTDKVLVFCGKKAKADHLSCELAMLGVDCACMHGNLEQRDREQAIIDLKDGSIRILIATDIISRGIDIQDITHVVNYDFPRDIEEYVHRVGRTGRAGQTGESISYFTRRDFSQAAHLIRILEEAGQNVPGKLRKYADQYEERKKFDDFKPRRGRYYN